MDYHASGGREIFLSFENSAETLYGLLRLRLQKEPPTGLETSGSAALVRELHIYGPEVSLGRQLEDAAQHQGLGRALLEEAERIAADESAALSIAVLSGTGARGYYRDVSSYHLEAGYMVKELSHKKSPSGMAAETIAGK
jgi:elongator complex protein 3